MIRLNVELLERGKDSSYTYHIHLTSTAVFADLQRSQPRMRTSRALPAALSVLTQPPDTSTRQTPPSVS